MDSARAEMQQTKKPASVKNQLSSASPVVRSGVILLIGTVLALWQYMRPYYWHEPNDVASPAWFFQPLEWNIDSALPDVRRDLHAVARSLNGNCLWIAGASGFLAYSPDQARSWNELIYEHAPDGQSAQFRTPTVNVIPCGMERPRAGLRVLSVVQRAYAEKPPVKSAQQAAADRLLVRPTNLNFGKVPVGRESTRAVVITNASRELVNLPPPYFVDAGSGSREPKSPFQVPAFLSSCGRLEPNSSCQVSITFHPTVEGASLWDLVVPFSAQSLEVRLEGYSTAPSEESRTQGAMSEPSRTLTAQDAAKTANPTPDQGTSAQRPAIPATPDLRSFLFGERESSVYTVEGWKFTTKDGGMKWTVAGFGAGDYPNASVARVGERVWTLKRTPEGTKVMFSADGGKHATEISQLPPAAAAESIYASSTSSELWAAGPKGVLFYSPDAGHAWWPLTRAAAATLHRNVPVSAISNKYYKRLIAPWYFALLILCAVLLEPVLRQARKKEKKKEKVQTVQTQSSPEFDSSVIGTQGVSDKPLQPGDHDVLELGRIAAGLSFLLRNEKTKPPLVISINGRWGSGKSSLMNLLKKKLEAGGAYPVWFNAWHHQKEEQLLAALLQAVKQQAVPPMFALNGARFRLSLLWKRVQRNWAHIGVVAALVCLVVQAEKFLRTSLQPPLDLWTLLTYMLQVDFSQTAENTAAPLGWLTGIVAGYQVLTRLLTAFGSKPEVLLSSIAGGAKDKDKEAQTSFRLRFAQEFHEVTTALPANQRMLILIDDLDRCRPEKLREIFEAVNFLVSSGDCFVVLGMARDMVEHYVGLSFRNVVEGLSWTALGLTDEDIRRAYAKLYAASPGQHPAAKRRRSDDRDSVARRWAFARLYLDKLVQIEITVPEPTTVQKRMLFAPERTQQQDKQEEKLRNAVRRLHWVRCALQPALRMGVIAILVIAIGFALSRTLANMAGEANKSMQEAARKKKEESRALTDTMTQIASGLSNIASGLPSAGTGAKRTQPEQPGAAKPVASSPTSVSDALQSSAANRPNPAASASPAMGGALAGANISWQSGWLGAWPFLLLLIFAGGVFSYALWATPLPNAEDTEVFTNAMTEWVPLVLTTGAKNTPRAAKRFQNRVRYLAMRQRALDLDEPVPLAEQWLRERLDVPPPRGERLAEIRMSLSSRELDEIEQARAIVDSGVVGQTAHWKLTPGMLPERRQTEDETQLTAELFAACITGRVRIPEPLLVAYAAIEEYEPSWITDEKMFQLVADAARAPCPELKDAALREVQVRTGWCGWPNLRLYRFAYIQLCSEVNRRMEKAYRAGA